MKIYLAALVNIDKIENEKLLLKKELSKKRLLSFYLIKKSLDFQETFRLFILYNKNSCK